MAYITNPNLPQGRVSSAFIDQRMSEKCRKALTDRGIQLIPLTGNSKLAYPVTSHPDMLCTHITKKKWVFSYEVYEKNKLALDCLFLELKLCREKLGANYPLDVLYNCCVVGKHVICKETALSATVNLELVGAGLKIVNSKQGYAKCSVCVVDDNSIITADYSIHEAAGRAGIDSLLISGGHIKLDGYIYGFIGGCSGKIAPNLIAFCGAIERHPDYKKILHFTKSKKIDIISLSDEDLYDYGSILPITTD